MNEERPTPEQSDPAPAAENGPPAEGGPPGDAAGGEYVPTARDFELAEALRAFRPAKKKHPRRRR